MSFSNYRLGLMLLIFFLLSIVSPQLTLAQQQYTITDLGTLGGNSSIGNDINQNGDITGWSQISQATITKGFVWKRGIMTALPTLANGKGALGVAISNPGFFGPNFTGDAELANGNTHAFRYNSVTMRDLGTLPGTTHSHGRDINDTGEVVGWAQSADGTLKAFLYRNNQMIDISNGSVSAAYGINNTSQVVGYFQSDDVHHAFKYETATGHTDLGTPNGYSYSYALAINQAGQIIGYVASAPFQTGNYRSFIFDSTNGFQIIGNTNNFANGINSDGQVVGSFKINANTNHGFIYHNSTMTDLNDLIPANSGWVITNARSINDKGQIVGAGTINGESHAFLMTPLPSTIIELPLDPERLNNKTQVVGEAGGHAVLWQQSNGLTDIGTLPNGNSSHAYDINDATTIVGKSLIGNGDTHAFKWISPNMTDLGVFSNTPYSQALGINSPGGIVGFGSVGNTYHAFFKQSTTIPMVDLGVLGGIYNLNNSVGISVNDINQVVGYSSSSPGIPASNSQGFFWTQSAGMVGLPGGLQDEAWDINNAGQIVGKAHRVIFQGNEYTQACLWTKDSQGQWVVDYLGTLSGVNGTGHSSKAFAINEAGQIVGSSTANTPIGTTETHAFLWHNGVMVDLNTLLPPNSGWILREARDINEFGQIIGVGSFNGQPAAFLLIP
ncbi:MAG: DUF3466 family protein [Acidobacteriota bacterium]